ncbi:MAG: M2 family metallopeptidase [Phycisphaerae bacterium]|nr:M2 family metallopeptidase [Phycisphaerae bacterium]
MRYVSLIGALCLVWLSGCPEAHTQSTEQTEHAVQSFIRDHVAKLQPLADQAALAYWEGATTGRPEAFDSRSALELRISQLYTDPNQFARLKSWRDSGRISDPVLKRQVDKLYYAFLKSQIPQDLMQRMVTLDTRVQETFNNYRPKIRGAAVTMSDIYTALTSEPNGLERELAWQASKEVGDVIINDLLALVRLRNEAARSVGFDNYYTLSVTCSEQDAAQIEMIFDELDRLTEEPFVAMKAELDAILAQGYGLEPEALMPWHYHDPFFQRTPLVYDLDLDAVYAGADIRDLCQRYYRGVDLPIDDILKRSDLHDREGKYPHAFSFEGDRDGDVRVLCNLQSTERWAETALHELGHAVYSKYHDRAEPWLLREPAHAFATEAVAMFFGRLSRNAAWMQTMLGLSDEKTHDIVQVSGKYLQFQQILFARWALVMVHFEKQLYADPEQDLNTLWWDLVEKYQKLHRPPGPANAGWASKLHFTSAPCYYHNYMLGELLASQFYHHIVTDVLKLPSGEALSLCDDPRAGQYFQSQVFAPGARYTWNDMIERATGEPLTAQYFVDQFIPND